MIDLVPAMASFALVGSVLRGFFVRRTHPFDLEWMEGGMLAHAWRLVHGLPLYPEPGPEWIPYVYPPGYAALVAALSPVFGLDYALGRTVSILGTLGAAGAVVFVAARRGQLLAGWVAAACLLGCWRASGGFYDLVRPDGLALGLLATTFALALERRRALPELTGLALCLAFVVKHHSAAFGFPVVLVFWLRDGWRVAARFGFSAAVPAGLFTLWMQWQSDGRFLQYLLGVPGSHPIDTARIVPGTPGELGDWLFPSVVAGALWFTGTLTRLRYGVPTGALLALPTVFAAGLAGLVWWAPEVRGVAMPPFAVTMTTGAAIGAVFGAALTHLVAALALPAPIGEVRDDVRRWWTAFLLGGTLLLVSTLMRGHYGGFLNVMMPAHLGICLGLAWVVVDLRRRWPGLPSTLVGAALLLVQVGWLATKLEVDEILPGPNDREVGERIVARLADCPEGPIFSPYAPWLAVQAGRDPGPHLIAIWDIDHDGPFRAGIRALSDAAEAHRWSCVVHGGRQPLGFGVEGSYRKLESFRMSSRDMMPKTGWRVRPSTLMVPKDAP